MDKVVHFEIPADDVERANSFYKKVFGWKMNPIPEMKYTIAHTGPTDENGMPKEDAFINGGMMDRQDDLKNPIITINVESIDDALKTIEENGGKIVREKITVGDMGYAAYFTDTEGNVLGVWENMKK